MPGFSPAFLTDGPTTRNLAHREGSEGQEVLDEILQDRVVSSRNRRNPRGVKRKMSNFPLRPRHVKALPKIDIRKAIRIVR